MHHIEDFHLWEKEYNSRTEPDELLIIQNTINFAQELQMGVVNSPARLRKQMGIEALHLLNTHPNDIKHHQFAFNVHHSYLTVHPTKSENLEGHTSKYGSMRVLGQVGLYGLDRFDDSGWLITLQLFDPIQISAQYKKDVFTCRLPEPLKLPVAAIELPAILIK